MQISLRHTLNFNVYVYVVGSAHLEPVIEQVGLEHLFLKHFRTKMSRITRDILTLTKAGKHHLRSLSQT